MSASPAAVAAAARPVDAPEGTQAVVLYEHGRYRYDERGAATYRYHRVYKVMNHDGASEWGEAGVSWAPWYQRAPTLRARVIGPDGVAHQLDPATIETAAARGGGDHMYSDRRSLRAPLPAMQPGAVVEVVTEVVDERPYFDAGDTNTWFVRSGVPVRFSRLEIDVPSSLVTRYAVSHKELVAVRSRKRRGRTVWTFDARDMAAVDYAESSLPSDVHRYATVRFSTGASWNDVATRYERIVEEQIAAGGVDGIDVVIPEGADRKRTAELVLAHIHANVRYTGLELGANAIVPWTPAQTWQRKYGDCKDKSTLLVALLRRAGVAAQLALLDTGPGLDVHPNLPGLGAFDHAIVVIPGEPALWVDPTNEFARVGELPWGDQDRWALIVDGATEALVKTPAPRSTDNVAIETRRVTVPEYGRARLIETTSLRGAWERSYRREYRADKPKDTRQALTGYIDREYLSKDLRGFSHSDADDLAMPFELTVDVGGTGRAEASHDEAWVWVFPTDVMGKLPNVVTSGKELSEPRVGDFEMTPFIHEQRYEIVVPDGFAVRSLPQDTTRSVGTGTLSITFEQRDSAVHATVRFDSGKPRLTAAELMAMKRAYDLVAAEGSFAIWFDQIGMSNVLDGEIRDGLRILRELSKAHPTHGLHHAQIARALLAAGLGSQARAAARRAVALDPTVETYFTLSWVLQHDELGRAFVRGYDRAGAIAALRKAKALSPGSVGVATNLAVALEYDELGVRYAGDLAAAIAEYRAVRAAHDDADVDRNLLWALMYDERWSELETFARSASDADADAFRLVGAVAARGKARVRGAADQLGGKRGVRAAALVRAGELLVFARRYEDAVAVYDVAIELGADADDLSSRKAVLGKMRRHDSLRKSGPESVVREMYHRLLSDPSSDMVAVADLIVPTTTATTGWHEHVSDGGTVGSRAALAELGMRPDVALDLLVSVVDIQTVHTAPSAWQLTVTARPGLGVDVPTSLAFVTGDGTAFQIVAIGDEPQLLGAHALALADAGDTAGARAWLHVATSTPTARPFESPVFALWADGEARSPERVKLAAAALASDANPSRAIRVLERCRTGEIRLDDACDEALINAYMAAGRYRDALAALDRRRADAGVEDIDVRGFFQRFHALLELHRWDAASAWANLEAHARFGPTTRHLARIAATRGDLRAARMLYGMLADSEAGGPGDANESAWASVFVGVPTDTDLRRAAAAVEQTSRTNAATLNTLAAVHAARGELADAYRVMLEAMTVRGVTRMGDQDWVVYGRILAGYGYRKAAARAYARVRRPAAPSAYRMSSRRLARRWTRQLRAR